MPMNPFSESIFLLQRNVVIQTSDTGKVFMLPKEHISNQSVPAPLEKDLKRESSTGRKVAAIIKDKVS